MSHIHVREGGKDGREWRVIFHIAVPNANSPVGLPWKQAVILSGNNKTQMTIGVGKGFITQAEYDAIIAGEVLEIASTFPVESDGKGAAKRKAVLDKEFNRVKTEAFNNLKVELQFFGLDRNVGDV